MDEGIVNYFYDKLQKGENPVTILVKLFSMIVGTKQQKNIYSVIGRLNNIYGTKIVFLSLLDMSSIEDLNKYSTIGLLNNICKRRFEEKMNLTVFNKDINKLAKENLKDLQKKNNLVIPEIGGFNDN